LSPPELRIDPLGGHRVILADAREHRPGGGLVAPPPGHVVLDDDPFAEGHEVWTPPELYAVRPDGSEADTPGWRVRVVPNLYPALTGAGPAWSVSDEGTVLAAAAASPPGAAAQRGQSFDPLASNRANRETDLFWSAPSLGAHEVIVNSVDPVVSLGELEVGEVAGAMDVWRERMRFHASAAYTHLIVNEQAAAGASVAHTHAQLFALQFVPSEIARERERFGAYALRTMGANLLGDLVQEEVRKRERIVAIDDEAVLMAPYGSRVPYQLLLAPRRPRMRFEDDGPTGAALLHDALHRLTRLLGGLPPLNLWVRTAPRGAEHYCWRIDILPRLTHPAGLELGVGLHINIVAPEHAAAQLREV
jgi:UDPglucose--hexose-1-phosphate uridylyltransferase